MLRKRLPREVDKEKLWEDYHDLINENIQLMARCEKLSDVQTKYDTLSNNIPSQKMKIGKHR